METPRQGVRGGRRPGVDAAREFPPQAPGGVVLPSPARGSRDLAARPALLPPSRAVEAQVWPAGRRSPRRPGLLEPLPHRWALEEGPVLCCKSLLRPALRLGVNEGGVGGARGRDGEKRRWRPEYLL